jgi:hypothetical protein
MGLCCSKRDVDLRLVQGASGGGADPTGKTVGNVGGVAVSSNTGTKVTRGIDAARVVDTGSLVEGLGARALGSVEAASETLASVSAGSTFGDHTGDLVSGARGDSLGRSLASGVAGRCTSVVLHQTGVGDTVVGGDGADTALGFLHDHSEDEAVVDKGGTGDLVNSIGDGRDLVIRVVVSVSQVDAGLLHERDVGSKHVRVGNPR